MTASSGFIGLVEDNDTLPDFIEVDEEGVFLEGDTFALVIPQDLQRESEYMLLAPAKGHKSVDITDSDSFRVYELPIEGQRSRIESLFEAIEEREFGEAARLTKSLTEFEATLLDTDVWSYTEDRDGVADVFRDRGRGHELELVQTLDFMRRFSFAASELEHKLVKLADGDEDDIREEIEQALDAKSEVGAEDVTSYSVRQDPGLSKAIKKVLRHYEEQGLVLAGGSPDSGIMLFVEPSALKGVNDAESAQRAAKIFMRGGRPMEAGLNFRARLVDFESGDYGHRDGIFMVLANELASKLARESGIKAGWSFQGQFIDIGRALMKGMVYVVGEDCPSWHLKKLLLDAQREAEEVHAAIDVSLWNKVVDTGHSEGDIVEVNPSDLWVMNSDVRSELGQVTISSQLVERAGEELQTWLSSTMGEKFGEFAEALKSGVGLEDYVSPFGRLGKMAELGLEFFRSDREDVREEMEDQVAQFARKGAKVQGTPIRLFHDDELSVDVTDGDQVPGARVPESWGLEEGDHFLFVAYPALPALDNEGRNTCIFTAQVEEVSPAPHVYLHGDVALNALRDEDGDEPICIVPEEGSVPVVGQADIGLSTINEQADNHKARIFEADVSSENVFEVFSRLGAQVGRADNLVTSTMLYLGDQIEHVDTPTGEDPTVFMSKAIQASIESMKHVTDEAYSLDELRQWTKRVVPEAWREQDGREKFVHHPALDAREPSDGETTIAEHIEALGVLNNSDTPNGVWAEQLMGLMREVPMSKESGEFNVVLGDEAFVEESFYEDAAWKLFQSVEGLFEDPKVADKAGKLGEQVWRDACDAGETARGQLDPSSQEGRLAYHRAQVRHLKVAALKLRMRLTPAEFAVVSAYFAMKYADGTEGSGRLKAALAVCSPSFLKTLVAIGEGELKTEDEILGEIGLDGRNKVTSDLADKAEHLGQAYNSASYSAGKQVLYKADGESRLEVGDKVTAGVPGSTVRKLTNCDAEYWLQDESQGELQPGAEYRVRDTAGYAVTLVRC